MLHLNALLLTKGVNSAKPILHAGEKLNPAALFHQILPGEGQVFPLGLLDHHVHIGQHAVNSVLPAKAVGLGPKLRRGHAQAWNEGVILHIRGAKGLVKVV